ncbi:hypothetical protein ACW9IB_12165 [Pseudomonas sp. SDO524_S393]
MINSLGSIFPNNLNSQLMPQSAASDKSAIGSGAADDIFNEAMANALKNGKLANKAKDISGIIQAAGRLN